VIFLAKRLIFRRGIGKLIFIILLPLTLPLSPQGEKDGMKAWKSLEE
jgi:hypothetical protein